MLAGQFLEGVVVRGVSSSESHHPLSWGMLFLSMFAFLSIGRVTDPFPFLWPLRLILVIGALAAIAWLLAPGSLADKIPMNVPQVRYVIFLMILGIISIALSVWPGASFRAVTEGLWKLVLFFILVCYWCRSVRDARRLIWMCCLGLSSLMLISLVTGRTDAEHYLGRFSAGSSMYDPNDLALVLAMVIPLLGFLLSSSGALFRLLIAAMGFLCLYGIILTQSRGGFLALATVVSLLLFRSKLSPSLKSIIAVGILMIFVTVAGATFWDRISTIWDPKTEYDQTAGDRVEKWKTALTIMATRPWGAGYGVCDIAIGQASGGKAGKWMTAHNSFLQIGVELGIPGLIIFLSLLVRTLRDLRQVQFLSRLNQQHAPQRELASMLEVSLYGFIVGGFFLSQAYSLLLYLIIGLSLVLSRMTTLDPSGVNAIRPKRIQPWAVREYGHASQ